MTTDNTAEGPGAGLPHTLHPAEAEAITEEQQRWADWLTTEAGDDDTFAPSDGPEDARGHLLDLVAAATYLTRGRRPDLTACDAIEEALRWWSWEQTTHHHGAPDPDDDTWMPENQDDPLHHTLRQFVTALDLPDSPPSAEALTQALRRWTTAMSHRHNAGHPWSLPGEPARP